MYLLFFQIYLDMAVLVDAQGEILDNIESQVCLCSHTHTHTLDFMIAWLHIECETFLDRHALIDTSFRSPMQSIMSREGHLPYKMLRNSRRILENGCALPSLYSC